MYRNCMNIWHLYYIILKIFIPVKKPCDVYILIKFFIRKIYLFIYFIIHTTQSRKNNIQNPKVLAST